MSSQYLIIDMTTGLMDGIYSDHDLARSVFDDLTANESGEWILVKVIEHPKRYMLPDKLFWAMRDDGPRERRS